MKKSAGFTLIELVIVIIILGILGAVAAPRLFNLQGDAYGANMSALRSSISSAATIANAKAQLGDGTGMDGTGSTISTYDNKVKFKFGYPIAEPAKNGAINEENKGTGIIGTLEDFDYGRYNIATTTANAADTTADIAEEAKTANANVLTISPKSINIKECRITYVEAYQPDGKAIVAARTTVETSGC